MGQVMANFAHRSCSARTYHGLENQGATCYLNSVLQVLYMTKEFREAIERHTGDSECMELHLKTLFDDLTKSTAQTCEITKYLGINDVYEQRDAAEYFQKILNCLEIPEASQIFQGRLTFKSKCSQCDTETGTPEPFWNLCLELVDSYWSHYRVEDGIDKYFRTSELQVYCNHCGAKCDSTIKRVINHHPEVLTLLLKRFKFDDTTNRYNKIRCKVDVPQTLQIPQGETYELFGVVDLYGDLGQGSYTTTIKEDETWYKFINTSVFKCDRPPFQFDSTTAYLLFYKKKNDTRNMLTNRSFQSDTSHSSEQQDGDVKEQLLDVEVDVGREKASAREKSSTNPLESENNCERHEQKRRDSAHVYKQADEEKRAEDVDVNEESTSGAGERKKASVSIELTTRSLEFQNNETVGDSKWDMSKNEKIVDKVLLGKDQLDNVGQNKSDDQKDKWEQNSVHVYKQAEEEKPVKDVEVNEESSSETGERKRAPMSAELRTSALEVQNNERVGDSGIQGNLSRQEGISNTSHTRHERQREEKRDVTEDKEQMKTRTYHGLENQGATCYLNSVLQVLYMTKEFRDAIKRHTGDSECMELHLKTLFDDLTKSTAQTCEITKYLGINRVYEQQDAAEYFQKILNSLTSLEASQIFEGRLTHKNKCSRCDTETGTPEPFWNLCLELVDSYWSHYQVKDGIEKYFRTSVISGENQVYCNYCEDKCDSTFKRVINHHPDVLMLLLKRFKFHSYYQTCRKISCSVDIPRILEIPEGGTYEVCGFVDHLGGLTGGHYTATIKCQEDETWYNFNDTSVTKARYQPFQLDNTESSRSAYLLFYRKKNVKSADTHDTCSVSSNGSVQSDTSQTNEECDVKTKKVEEDEEAAEKARTYHGLENQGATCYLNSVLQVLYMTKEFRDAIKRHTGDSECMELHLKTLFDDLTKSTAQTCEITKYLGINRVYEQQDAAEYLQKILNSLTSLEASQIFEGRLTHKNKCSQCDTETGTPEPFWNLCLELVDSYWPHYHVKDGIEKYFRTSVISGENQVYCNYCEDKCDSTFKRVINHHPDVLMLLLKRFKFHSYYQTCRKISCSVDIPRILEIPEGGTYEVCGIVDHLGGLTGGHYTATIKCQEDETWYNFNDTSVTKVRYQPFQLDNTESSCSAYLLFYRKQNVKSADTQDTCSVSSNGSVQSDTSQTNEECDVKTKNVEEDEEAAEKDIHTVAQQENKRIEDSRGDTESQTGDDEHVGEQTEKILGENGERSENERQNYERVGDSGRQGNLSRQEGISNTSHTRHERQREEKRDVTEVKEQMTTRTYHGLENQGATCYLNSVLQVLYMTKEFREAIERHTGDSECMELHLKTLFDDLTKSTAQTCEITKYLGINDVNKQQDAAEYFQKIQSSLSPEASQLFQGHLTHKNKCSQCDTETGTSEPFWNLCLELAGSYWSNYHVEDGIDKYFKTSELQVYCNHCGAKCDSTIKRVINHHPEVLTLLLKRFRFDDTTNRYTKIRCKVDVPQTLQIPQGETYELFGFFKHNEDLEREFYTTTIKDDETWYKFINTSVFKCYRQPFQFDSMSSTAYLLFYRKKNVKVADTQDTMKMSNNGTYQSDSSHGSEKYHTYTRKKKRPQEAAEVDQEEKKKRIMEDSERERDTGDNKHAEQREKSVLKNVGKEALPNICQDQDSEREQGSFHAGQQGDEESTTQAENKMTAQYICPLSNSVVSQSNGGERDESWGRQREREETTEVHK